MNFKKYVCRHGRQDAAHYAYFRDFPRRADWRELKLFVNKCEVPDEIAVQLEALHDTYHSRFDLVKFLFYKIFKR